MENVGQQSPVMNFKVETGFVGQAKNFFENKSNIFYEKGINK
jgi:hypothetical protein